MTDIVERLRGKGVGGAVAWVAKATDLCIEAADEIERLNRELDSLRAERDALARDNEQLREDAERYRWLKNRGGEGPLMKMACAYSHSSKTNFSTPLAVLEARTADDAIDAALKVQP